MELEALHSAACRLHKLQVLRPLLRCRLEPPAAQPTASRAPELYRVQQPRRSQPADPNPQQIARLLQEKRSSNKGVEGLAQNFNQAEGELLFTREKLSTAKIRQYDGARVEQRAQVKGLQSWQQLEAVFDANSSILFATSSALLLKQLARLTARNFRRMRRGDDPKSSLHMPRRLVHRLFERGLQQAAAFEPRDLVNLLTGCHELRLELQPQDLQVLDKAATFCMHAFNPRILTEYVQLRGPLASQGLPPSRELSQGLKLRLLQIVHELDFADVAGCLPPLLPGEAGQEVLGAACRQIEAAVQDAGPPDVRSMLSCLAAFAASGQLAARLAASAKARATHSAPESHPSEPPMLIMDPDTDPDLEFDLDFGPDSDLEGDLELSEDSSPAQLHSQAQEDPPGTRQPSGGVRGLPPWMLSASSSGSQQAQHHPQPPQQQGQQLQEPAVLAAVARAGCVRWELADVGPVLQLMAGLQAHGMLPLPVSGRAGTDILKTTARQLRQLRQRHQGDNFVTGVKVPTSLCTALTLAPRLGAELLPEELGTFLAALAHARLEKLRLVDCCELLQVSSGWGEAPGQSEFLARLFAHAEKTFPRAKPPAQVHFLQALAALLQDRGQVLQLDGAAEVLARLERLKDGQPSQGPTAQDEAVLQPAAAVEALPGIC